MAIGTTKQEVQATLDAIRKKDSQGQLNRGDLINRSQAQAKLREFEKEETRTETTKSRIAEGLKLGKELLPEGKLGRAKSSTELERVDTGAIRQGRSQEIADIIARRKQNLSGFTAGEEQAKRDIGAEQIGRQTEGARRQLQAAQARTGVRGGTASAQQLEAILAGTKTRANFERDLFLENVNLRRDALNKLESSVTGAEASEAQRSLARSDLLRFNVNQQAQEQQLKAEQERFNLQQAARESFGQIATGTAFASLLAGEAASDKAVAAQIAAAQAQKSGDGCVIATHAMSTGAFESKDREEAITWCKKMLHGNWVGETIRKGYKKLGNGYIKKGVAHKHYQEFQDYVHFGNGKNRTLKTGFTFIYRTIQMFFMGLFK